MSSTSRSIHAGGPTEEALFDFVAGRLHPQASEWIDVHVMTCVKCTAAVTRVRAVREALEAPEPSPFAAKKAIAEVRRRLDAPRPRRSWRVPALGAFAVTALVVVVGVRLARRGPELPSPPLAQLSPAAPFSVVARAGGAEVEANGAHALVQSRTVIPDGAALLVKPESRVVARWGGARVVVDGGERGARLTLVSSNERARKIRLERGRVILDVDPLGANAELAILTVDDEVSVRGTRFLVERKDEAGTLVAVEHGRVRVASRGRTVEIVGGARLSPRAPAATPLEAGDLDAFARSAASLSVSDAASALDVFADAPRAEVSIDGVPQGRAPVSLAVAPGAHRVRVSAAGRLPVEERVEVSSGAPTLFSAELPEVKVPATRAPSSAPPPSQSSSSAPPSGSPPSSSIAASQKNLSVDDVLGEARADLLAGNYARAVDRLESLRRRTLTPTEMARVSLLAAQAHRLDKKPERALPLLEKVARGSGPEAEQAQLQLAQTLQRDLLEPRRAADAWLASLTRFPSGIFREEAAYRVGEALLQAGETVDGVAALEKFLATFPRGAHADDAHLAIASARRDRLGDCTGALPHLRAVAGGKGARAEIALVGEARCYKTLGRADESRAAYRAYLSSEPHGRFAEEARAALSTAERSGGTVRPR